MRTRVVQAQGLVALGQLEQAALVLQRAADRALQAQGQQQDGEPLMYTACAAANAQLGLAQLYDHPNRASRATHGGCAAGLRAGRVGVP